MKLIGDLWTPSVMFELGINLLGIRCWCWGKLYHRGAQNLIVSSFVIGETGLKSVAEVVITARLSYSFFGCFWRWGAVASRSVYVAFILTVGRRLSRKVGSRSTDDAFG